MDATNNRSKKAKNWTQSQNNTILGSSTIFGQIESLVADVNNMQYWDPD